ncbi:MAG: ComF family protein [Negativicutes bacterium]|nr:ComF family protein [Negativicutes bacterium]
MLKLWYALLDLIYPPKCPACRSSVAEHGAWCSRCLADFYAPRAIDPALHHLRCLDACYVLCDYRGGLKRIVHDMKFRQAARYARHLGWLLGRRPLPGQLRRAGMAVPVPLHAERLRERGYNQNDLIYKQWASTAGFVWREALVRSKKTIPQWELSLAERRRNVYGAFRVAAPEAVAGEIILLVDDIFTSGLTMDECAKELKLAGAREVYGLALASGAR